MKKNCIFVCIITLATLGTTPSFAKDTADIIPKSINRARVVYVQTGKISQTLNADSKLEGITASLNQGVTVNTLANSGQSQSATDLQTLISTLNTLDPGLGDSLGAANLFSDYSLQMQQFLLAYERGITKNINIGVRMPIVRKTIENEFRVESQVNGNEIKSILQNSGNDDLVASIDKFITNTGGLSTAFFEEQIFTNKGYKTPANINQTDFGDMELGAKWQYFKNHRFINSVTLGFRVPFGSTTPLDNPFNKGVGKGAWGVGLKMHQDMWIVTERFGLGSLLKVAYSLPDTRDRAVPKDEDDALPSLLASADQVHAVKRQRGLELEGELSAEALFFDKVFSVSTAFQYLSKTKDSFSGGPANLRVDLLAEDTDYYTTNGELGAQVSTIPLYFKKKFPVPMQVSVLYNSVLSGKNAPDVAYGRMDLKVYF